MSCTNCKPTLPIPTCVNELTIGVIGSNNAPVMVMIRDISQNRTTLYPATSDANGVVKISPDITFAENHSYEISILDDSGTGWIELSFDNTNGDGIGDKCIAPRFERIFDNAGNAMVFATHTITIIEP